MIPVNISSFFKPAPKDFNKECPVILQVGAGENKNLERLVEALNGIACKLVIIGKPAGALIEKMNSAGIDFSVKTNLSEQELYTEYVNCDIVSFVSVFEGFGMPVVEANMVERPVITASVSSMPEVAGNAACLVDPYDVQAIREGMLKIIADETYRNHLVQEGRINRQRFDTQKIAEAYYNIYKKIAEQIND